jgi:hypothetical protein
MTRIIQRGAIYFLAALAVAGLALLPACNASSSSSSGSGSLRLLVTDAPSDDWQEVTVMVKSVSLYRTEDQSWNSVWTADSTDANSGKLNLIDLSGVAQILGQATIPAGTYNRLKLVINTDPTTMKLVDDSGTTIDAANIMVVDPAGTGEIKVDIDPSLSVTDGSTNVLQVDFDLAHPLSIIVESGKVIINLQLRHKAVPKSLQDIQFARTLGTVKEKTDTSFTVTNDQGTDVVFNANANSIFVDVDNNKTGSLADMPAGTGHYALVDSNMNSDGSLYARRVWYSADETALPVFTPEGLVRRVGDNWIKVLNKNAEQANDGHFNCHWDTDVIYVDANTVWTFQTNTAMGAGTDVLKYIRRGFRVAVEFVDATASPRVAKSINVQSAHDEGAIRSVTATGFTFGGRDYCHGWNYGARPDGGQSYTHEWLYSTVTDHVFSWWFFGLPSVSSTSIQDFMDSVSQANSAHLRVFARAELYWDATNTQWVAENVVLAPEKLPDPTKITTAYTAASGSMGVSTYDWDYDSVPATMTVYLDTTGDLQTVVGSLRWNTTTQILTFTVPVVSSQWETLLTTSLFGVRVWVRPVKGTDGTYTWRAYTVFAFQIIS